MAKLRKPLAPTPIEKREQVLTGRSIGRGAAANDELTLRTFPMSTVLTGKYRGGERRPPNSPMALRPGDRALSDWTHDTLDVLCAIAEPEGPSCAAVALASVPAHSDFTAPVVGPSLCRPQLEYVAEALTLRPADTERARLGQVFSAAFDRLECIGRRAA
jgi:aryl-alcohol dehydrogenase-like predicted oxidoreductase